MKQSEKFKQIRFNNEDTSYWISNYGRLWSNKTKKFLKPYKSQSGKGYYSIKLSIKNQRKSYDIHRLVATYFCNGKTNEKNIVNHIDGNIFNNYYENLEWTTTQENTIKGQLRTGRHFLGNATGCILYKDGIIIGEFKSITQAAKYASQRGGSSTSLQKYYKDQNGWSIKRQ